MNTKLGITNDGEQVGVHILACMKNASDTIPPLSAQVSSSFNIIHSFTDIRNTQE